MILRNIQWTIILHLVYLFTIAHSQDGRSYDTNDWIPITPSSVETKEEPASPRIDNIEPQIRKATGRVLNLDAPAQKFFPDEEYRYRKRRPQPQPTQHLEQKVRFNGPKYKDEYKFVVPPPPQKATQNLQYFTNQEVKLQSFQQPPPPPPQRSAYHQIPKPKPAIPPPRDRAPLPNAASIYEQYQIPLNNTYYEAVNPSVVNQELLGSLQNVQQNPALLDQQLLGAIQKNNFGGVPTTLPPTAAVPVNKEKDSVQLVYVPLENLKSNQQIPQSGQTIYRQIEPLRQLQPTPSIQPVNTKQHHLENIQQDFIAQALHAHNLQEQIQAGQPIIIQTTPSTTTTPKPKKRKPHQPPLSVYMEGTDKSDVTDVLEVLKDAKSIAVQDSIQKNSPAIFIGPSSLSAPEGYHKFPLPYLNSIDGNRVERKVDNLPFFVAPLSYKTPAGYSKIPLPSPHVGSVVVSHKDEKVNKKPVLSQNQVSEQFKYIKQNSVSSTTATPQLTYDSTPSNQNYFSQGQSVLSSQPEYNQYKVNSDVKPYNIPADYYVQQPQLSTPEIQAYNLPISQLFDPNTNIKYNQFSYPEYQQLEQNDDNKPVPKTESVKPQEQPKEQKLAASPTLQSTSNDYLEPLNYNQQSQAENTQHKVPVRQFQQSVRPKIRQQIKNTALQHQYQDEFYDIPTRVPLIQENRATPSRNTKQYQTIQQNRYQEDIYDTPTRTTLYQENRGTPSRNTHKYQTIQESDVSYTTPRTSPGIRYNTRQNLKQEQQTDGSTVSITPRNTTPGPTTIPESEGIITSYYPQNVQKPQVVDVNPLELAINEFELHQINTQLEEKPNTEEQYNYNQQIESQAKPDLKTTYETPTATEKPDDYRFDPQLHRFGNSPATILRDTYETTIRPTPKTRRRGRPTKVSTTTATAPTTKETYTVLEDFSIKQPSTEYPRTPTSVIDEVPASVYSLQTTTENSVEVTKKPIYDQAKVAQQYENVRTEIEELPAKVYSLNVNQNAPVYSEPASQQPQNQHILNQYAMDQVILQYNNKYSSPGYEEPSHENSYFTQKYNEQPVQKQEYKNDYIKPLVQNRGQKEEYYQPNLVPQDYYSSSQENSQELNGNQVPDEMSEFVKSLQDQSVRTLLIPNLLAPTTENAAKHHERPIEISSTTSTTTTTTTTTEIPETTTHSRTRSRTRGGTRFSQAASTTRRPLTRRRPVHSSRTTTDRSSSTTDHSDFQRSSTKQRFRTRGRTTPSAVSEERTSSSSEEVYTQPRSHTTPAIVSERISSTDNEVYNGPTSEQSLNYYKPSNDLDSVSQFEHVVDQQRIVTNRPDIDLTEQYQRIYTPSHESPRPIIQYENTAQTTKPVEYYRAAVVTESGNRITAAPNGYVVSPRQEIEEHTKANFRVRGRARTRTKPTTTTTSERPTTRRTTPKPVHEEEHAEFFGFIRAPNFKTVPIQQTQYAAATEQPQFYSNSFQPSDNKGQYFSEHPKEELRLRFENTDFDTTTVRFLGEIKPKYPSTTTTEPVTQTPKPRIRTRLRTSAAKKASDDAPPPRNHRPTYQTVNAQEQATRRSNVIRSRGKVHYQVPESVRPKSDEEADVEGGNYPETYLQHKQSTAAPPSFQITVDPHEGEEDEDDEDDQKPHSSMYSPRLARPDEWHEASEYTANDEGYASDNRLAEDVNQDNDTESEASTTTEPPIALPVKATTEDSVNDTTDSSEEVYRKNQQAIDDLFETVNQFEKTEETTTTEEPTTKKRGVWKLVKHRPIDHLEVAESQNYHSVLNVFDELKKEDSESKIKEKVPSSATYQTYNNYNPVLEQNSDSYEYESHKLTSTETPQTTERIFEDQDVADEYSSQHNDFASYSEDVTDKISDTSVPTATAESSKSNIFDTFYDMFGINFNKKESKPEDDPVTSREVEVSVTTSQPSPTFPEEMTEQPGTTPRNQTGSSVEIATEQEEVVTTLVPEVPKNTFPVEPWEMKKVRTSTSTEISHETEICYKGRCIKAPSKNTRV